MGVLQKISIGLFGIVLASSAQSDASVGELKCLADNIYFEGRNQPWIGQVAIGQVTLNRTKNHFFPETICEVVKQGYGFKKCQFSWYCDGRSDIPREKTAYSDSLKVAMFVLSESFPDVTGGAQWYHAVYINKPFWAHRMKETVRINDHIFYASK